MYNNAIFVDCIDKVPAVKHWAIYLNGKYSSPGYGPNEPSYSSNMIKYQAYLDKSDWEAAIRELIIPSKWSTTEPFKVAEINPIEVKFELKLET